MPKVYQPKVSWRSWKFQFGSSNKLEEADIEEMVNTDNDAPVVHSFSDGDISETVLSTDQYEDSSYNDNDDMSAGKKNSP